jgi:DNA-binding MarR family transcriptional regulator
MKITVEVLTDSHFAHISTNTVDERCQVSVMTLEGKELCTAKLSESMEKLIHKLVSAMLSEVKE